MLGLTSYVPGALADPAPAHALEATRVWLDWETGPGTEGCISRDDAAKEVERTLGRRVFVAREEAERTLHVQLERAETPSRYSAHMTLLSARGTPLGERDITIESTSCAGATDGITLALSIMADLARTREEEEEAKTPPAMPPSPPVATTPPPVRPPPRPAEKRNERRWQGFVGFGPAVTFDGNADFAPGLHVFGLVDPPGFLPLALSGLQTVRPFDTPQGGTFWQSTSQIDASVCAPSLRRGKFELDGCLGPQATLYVAWGSGLMENRSGVSATFGGALRVYGTVAVARGVRLFGTLGLSATPQRIDIKTLDLNGQKMSIHETSTVTAVSSIGVALDIF
ncbi:hypothetical protein AKJ09_04099 [Labilithrix luteola]|uniref:Uncharacterized protein n=1 Tax=Labilithrix luteola TaxID=1391654 RepID=A0A0K1PV78_9BACT|nr:hypothetical protein AKJ09_04099 [Labilithrix luteola]